MNEHIKRLADKCREEYVADGKYLVLFDEEKFAEMIVRECIALLGSESEYGRNHIKRHFGVE